MLKRQRLQMTRRQPYRVTLATLMLELALAYGSNDWQQPSMHADALPCTVDRKRACEAGADKTDEGAPCLSPEEFDRHYKGRKPVILFGLTDQWPAHRRWAANKTEFLKRYGHLSVSMVSAAETAIDFPAEAFAVVPLVNATHMHDPENFVFDFLSVFRQPGGAAMLKDFNTPAWAGLSEIAPPMGQCHSSMDNGPKKWHMLTYGTHGAGLGWHTHGQSWVGIVTGAKRWFLYPPGKGVAHLRKRHPFDGAQQWLDGTYPHLPEDERPLECVQPAGAIMYLPAGWPHMTLNDGEVIGAGAQATSFTEADFANHRQGVEAGEVTTMVEFAMQLATTGGKLKSAGKKAMAMLERANKWHPHQLKSRLALGSLLFRMGDMPKLSKLLTEVETTLTKLADDIIAERPLKGPVRKRFAMLVSKALWLTAQGLTEPAIAPFLAEAAEAYRPEIGFERAYALILRAVALIEHSTSPPVAEGSSLALLVL